MATIILHKSTADLILRFVRDLDIEKQRVEGKSEAEALAFCAGKFQNPVLSIERKYFSFTVIDDQVEIWIDESIIADLLDSMFGVVKVGIRVYHALTGLGIFEDFKRLGQKFVYAIQDLTE